MRPASKKYYYVVAAAVLFFVAAGMFLIPRVITVVQKSVPLPTAIDPNFSTQVNECFIPVAAAYGYSLRIVSGFRSMAQQQQVYDQGRLENGVVVSEASPGHSLHNYGFAVDVADIWRGYNINWPRLIAIGAYCGLGNGGVGDYPHFEYRGGLVTADFAAGKRPPLLTLPCAIMDARAKASKPLTLKDLQGCAAPKF
ncbi:MAG: M15 family metallopeptidase [Patescibacteria group bacterium]|nr:M15 family metallopeptidase [Patescibacteria group bacterium]MDE2015362.1 M15 family metallopeptidase [Patescibacteria group bacterium]MDE2227167.1 M15 family metallopeptidase [Patescibacteria group bacterium]